MYQFLMSAAEQQGGGLESMLPLLLIYAAFFVVIYFVAIRPSRKRDKETQKMQQNLANGDWVLLNNGMYGKIVKVVNENLMVEFGTNKSIIIPVRRDQIAGAVEPDLTEKKIEAVEKAPEDAVVGDDLAEDQLDTYDKYMLEKGKKKGKNSPFGQKKQ